MPMLRLEAHARRAPGHRRLIVQAPSVAVQRRVSGRGGWDVSPALRSLEAAARAHPMNLALIARTVRDGADRLGGVMRT